MLLPNNDLFLRFLDLPKRPGRLLLLTYRERQPIRIGVDRQSPEVFFLRRLNAFDALTDLFFVEGVEICDGQPDLAVPRWEEWTAFHGFHDVSCRLELP